MVPLAAELRNMRPDCGQPTDCTLSLGFNQPHLMTWVAHVPAEAVGVKPTRDAMPNTDFESGAVVSYRLALP